jgi:serine/threonine protein kinase
MPHPLANIYHIDTFNDTFALGHYARVMDAQDRRSGQSVAFKLLRPEHMSTPEGETRWEVRAFVNEANLLTTLADSPYVVGMLDCGYLSGKGEAPVGGEIVPFGVDSLGFANHFRDYVGAGWRPYLALENLPRHHNLFYLMKPNTPGTRRRLPTEEGLALALQFAELLRTAHRQNIVYLDHKLEHVYWDGMRLQVIDLNSSRQVSGADVAAQKRADIHNLCVGILYPVFTGLSPIHGTLRPQPGNQQAVATRYADVTALDFGSERTLSPALVDLLNRGAAQGFENVDDFLDELQQVASRHGWDFPEQYTSAASRNARTQVRAGLKRLREGEDLLREARDLFREAAIEDNISEDMENELRRLVKAVNETLNHRAIP